MKVSTKVSCEKCLLKCDIFTTTQMQQSMQINPVHACYKKHEIICKQGTEVTHAIFLISGTAKLYIEGLNNRNIILYILKPPAYIGLLSFFESPNYSYSVAALEDSEVCMIDLALVKQLYIGNHDLLLRLNKAFGKSVSNIMKKIISLNQKQIRGRIAENLLYLAEFNNSNSYNLKLTRRELGEMAAISEENTVRLLSEFAKENIISLSGKEIKILDINLLKKISELG